VDGGNTVITVAHDISVAASRDRVIDLGCGEGEDGGRVVLSGQLLNGTNGA